MSKRNLMIFASLLVVVVGGFMGGYLIGKTQVSTPSTVIHHVVFKWKADTSEADKKAVLDGLREIVNTTEGVRNFWMKSVKIQPNDFSQTFVIEFANQQALEAYAKHPKKKAWEDVYYKVREVSQNCVTTN